MTTPRDAIGLSERLREPVCLAYDAEQINADRREAAAQLDSLSVDNASLRLRLGRLARIVNGLESALDCPPSSVAIFDAIDQLKQDRSALSARVKELEEHNRRLGQGGAERYWEGRYRDEAAERTALSLDLEKVQTELDQEHASATRAEQERDRVQSELDTANDNHRAMAAQLSRIGQERDEALERAAQCAECIADEYDATSFTSVVADQVAALRSKEQAAHEIAAAIRHLASGPDKEKRE